MFDFVGEILLGIVFAIFETVGEILLGGVMELIATIPVAIWSALHSLWRELWR